MFKALTLLLLIGQIIEFVDSFRFGLFKLVIVVHFDFLVFIFLSGLVFFQDIIMWGEGVY